MKSTILFLALLGLPGCATLGKGLDYWNRNGFPVTISTPIGVSFTIGTRPSAPIVSVNNEPIIASPVPTPADPPTAEAPTAGNEVAKK